MATRRLATSPAPARASSRAKPRRKPAAGGGRAPAPTRRRLPAAERERQIVEEAAALFAEHGFGGTTRELARRLGVTQALLYRYFPSKQALIERVFEATLGRRWRPEWDALLRDRALPLEERLTRFYRTFVGEQPRRSLRLFVRAGLEGQQVALRHSPRVTERVLAPLIAELRHAQGLPGFSERPLMRGERELGMMLHGGLVFLNIRRHVYQMPMQDGLDDLVALHVRAFLPGAAEELQRLHDPAAPDSLTVRQLAPAVEGGGR